MKDLGYLQLFDVYGPLLTETQQEICNLYYMCDLSLSEIAEEKGVTKQSVSDTLKKSRELLDSYEGKLHHSQVLTDVLSALATFGENHPEHAGEMKKIADIVALNAAEPLKEE